MDFGVGTGQVLSALDVASTRCNVFAVDAALGMIEACKKKFPDACARQAKTACEISTFGWPLFDVILSSGVFEYVEQIDHVLGELKKLPAPGGELIFTYEPIISYHPNQSARVARTSWTVDYARAIGLNLEKDIEVAKCRWHMHEIEEITCVAGLKILEHQSLIAHYDGTQNHMTRIPKIYNLVRCKST